MSGSQLRYARPLATARWQPVGVHDPKPSRRSLRAQRQTAVGISIARTGTDQRPTPLPISDTGLLISGQGAKGTRRLEITPTPRGHQVGETWQSNEQFFYCNWVRRGNVLWGCNGKLLVALDLESGNRLGRFRGYAEGNLLAANDRVLYLDGEGHLSKLSIVQRDLRVDARYSVFEQRCWTPPTPMGNLLFCRGGDQLLCLDLTGGDSRAAVTKTRTRNTMLTISKTKLQQTAPSNPIDAIRTAYEEDGAETAWKTYTEIRTRDPDSIGWQARLELVALARQEGLHDFAKLITDHAAEDFPEEAKEAQRQPSNKTSKGKNGLTYVELAIFNRSNSTIQAYVQGPQQHRFSYGLPLRSKARRIESWPVGTKLYETHNGVNQGLLLTVQESFAGQTVTVPPSR